MNDNITYRGTVYPWHCDHMGHMNVMWYVGKFDEAIWNLFAQLGLTPAWLRSRDRGMAAVEQTIRYQRELHAGDVVEVHSQVTELRAKALLVEQTMRRADTGETAARMNLVAVHLDRTARAAVALPEEIVQRVRARLLAAPAAPAPFQL
ncbi:MAG: acyl-CoA thioesterase [Piscinibacter sp.]|nr:acyl-CoA thioesterase [Piscinibacter sp.]